MSIKRHEYSLGERFELCKLIYEVRESVLCDGCSFFIKEENHCTFVHGEAFHPCDSFERRDGKDVIFVKVGELA